MKKVKIATPKATFDQKLTAEYGAEVRTACPMLREGQVFYADYARPGLYKRAPRWIYMPVR